MQYGPRIYEPMRMDPETAEGILPPILPQSRFTGIVMVQEGENSPYIGVYAVMVSRGWLSSNFPRAWAAWVLDKGVFALTAEEIAIYAPTDAD